MMDVSGKVNLANEVATTEEEGRPLMLEKDLETAVFLFGLLLIILFGVCVRLDDLASRSLEYDEIWTLQHYASANNLSAVFGDLATPNNHPLHSFLVGLSVRVLGETVLAIRLPALAPGILLLLATGYLAWRLFRSRSVVLMAVALVAANGGLIHYAQTSRGYSLQLCS